MASRGLMTVGDQEGWIFLSHPHPNNGFFFLLTPKLPHFILEKHEKDFKTVHFLPFPGAGIGMLR